MRRILFISWIALTLFIVGLFLPYQIVVGSWGDNENYPPEYHFGFELFIPFIGLLLNVPLHLKLIKSSVMESSGVTEFFLATTLLIFTLVLTFLLSSVVSAFMLAETKLGVGAYLNLMSALLFFFAVCSKPLAENQQVKKELLDNE